MPYTPPNGTLAASWAGAGEYAPPKTILWGSWPADVRITPVGMRAPVLPDPTATIQQFAAPQGWFSGADPASPLVTYDWQYRPPFLSVHATWAGTISYTPPAPTVNAAWTRGSTASDQFVFVDGFDAAELSEPSAIWPQYVLPDGWTSGRMGAATVRPPPLNASWHGAAPYAPAQGVLWGRWAPPVSAAGLHIYPNPEAPPVAGVPHLVYPRALAPSGLDAAEVSGGTHIINVSRQIWAGGFDAASVPRPLIWNWRQYAPAQGWVAQQFGTAYIQGGVKTVDLGGSGLAAALYGKTSVINTTANQSARPAGITPVPLASPGVSPRTLWPLSIYGTVSGFPVVQFPPQPRGWQSSTFGYATVEYKTKQVRPGGIDSYVTGFGVVRDRAQKVLHQAPAVTAVFGDIAVRVTTQRLRVGGWYSMESGSYGEVRSNLRHLLVRAIAPPGMGGVVIHNKTPSLAPPGWLSLAWGGHNVGWRIRSIGPAGIGPVFGYFPAPSLWQTPSLGPLAIAPPAMPRHTIWPAVREVGGVGHESERVGLPTAGFSYRLVVAEGKGIAGAAYGKPRVEHERRTLSLLSRDYMAFGVAWVAPGRRAVGPLGIREVDLHLPRVGGAQFVGPEGFYATLWLTRITPESRELFPKTFGAVYGWPTAAHFTRYVRPESVRTYSQEELRWGTGRAWNRRQYVAMHEDHSSQLAPLPWPQWTLVKNRNQSFGVIGFNAGRVPSPSVDNGARAIQPYPIHAAPPPEYAKFGAISHRVRPLRLDGIDAPPMAGWGVVYNGARPVFPSGFDAAGAGRPELVNLRRFYRVQGFDSAWCGYPFVADKIRELTFESRYGIAPPRVEVPAVHLHVRYIEPTAPAWGKGGFGTPALTIFWRKITPRWVLRDLFGDPALKNLTPELITRGRASDEFGATAVRLEWRPVTGQGSGMELFGRTRIADRTQRLAPTGADCLTVSDKVTVRRFGAVPVATQHIDLRKFFLSPDGSFVEGNEGFGIEIPKLQVGTPDLLKGYIFHNHLLSPGDMSLFGKPQLFANSIRVEPGIFDFYIGKPHVSLLNRVVDVPTLGQLIHPSSEINWLELGSFGKPALSPHRIYAVLEVTPQAKMNHGRRTDVLRAVNTINKFGGVRVSKERDNTLVARGITPTGAIGGNFGFWGLGTPRIQNKTHRVVAYGGLMSRMGWHSIPGTQEVAVENDEFAIGVFGRAAVAKIYVGPLYARPPGVAAPALAAGALKVDLRNRAVRPTGVLTQAMGRAAGGGNMPQGLHVGPPNLHEQVGFDAALYGASWVSNRIRGIEPQGDDFFACTYDYQQFDQRMRVRNADQQWLGRRMIGTVGHASSRVGAPSTRMGTHYIRPDGNSDQHRKGVTQ